MLSSLKQNKNQLSMVVEEESQEVLALSPMNNLDIEDNEDEIQIPKNSEKFWCGSLMTPFNRHVDN